MARIGRGHPVAAYTRFVLTQPTSYVDSADDAALVDSVVTVENDAADTAACVDDASISQSEADTGSGVDAHSVGVSEADTGAAVDTGTTGAAAVADADTATGADDVDGIAFTDTDSGSGVDAADLEADIFDDDASVGIAVEDGTVPFDPSDSDTATAVEASLVSTSIVDSDSSNGPLIDAELSIGVATTDTGSGSDAVGSREFGTTDASGAAVDAATVDPQQGDMGAAADATVDTGVIPATDPGHALEATSLDVRPVTDAGVAADTQNVPTATLGGSDTGTAADAGSDIVFADPPVGARVDPALLLDEASQIDVTGDDASAGDADETVIVEPHVGETASAVDAAAEIDVNDSDVAGADDSSSGTPLGNLLTGADTALAVETWLISAVAPVGADTVSVTDVGALDRGVPEERTVRPRIELRLRFVGAADRTTAVLLEPRTVYVAAELRIVVPRATRSDSRTLVPAR